MYGKILTFLLLPELKKAFYTPLKTELSALKLDHRPFLKILEAHSIEQEQAEIIFGKNILQKLIEYNILMVNNRRVSFHSRYIETYFREVIIEQYCNLV